MFQLITEQNLEVTQPGEDVNVFYRKSKVVHVSAQRRSHLQINFNQEVVLPTREACFIHGRVERRVPLDARELERSGLIMH